MVRNPNPLKWLDKKQKIHDKHESSLAEDVNGKRTVGSGNKSDKGDVKTKKYRYEAKATEKRSFSIKLDWLEKITKEAIDSGRLPVLSILLESAESPCTKKWVMIEQEHFIELSGG